MATSFKSKLPTAVATYFGPGAEVTVEEAWFGARWIRCAPRVSLAEMRRLSERGATRVAFRCGDRVADFAIEEVQS